MIVKTWTRAVGLAVVAAMIAAAPAGAAERVPATDAAPPAAEGDAGRYDFRRTYDNSPYARPATEFGQQGPLDWPAAEFREVAYARARSVITRYDAMRAREAIGRHIDSLWRRFESSPEIAAARQAEDQAWAEYQSAVASVLARLSNDPDYLAATQLAADVGRQIEDAKFDQVTLVGQPGGAGAASAVPAVFDLAHVRLNYARRATEMRSAALAADAAVTEARARLTAASDDLRALRTQFASRVRDSDDVLVLRENLWEARTASVAAAAYEDSARLARRWALDYAYYLHRNDASPYYGSTYDGYYGGYGRPWISPYDVGAVQVGGGYGFRRR